VTRIRWWIAGSTVAVVILAVAGVVIWQDARPDRAATVATVTPSLDHAIADVVAAAGDGAATTVTELVPTTSCSGGNVFTVTANLYTNAGAEDALIDQIAASIPASDDPHRTAALDDGASSLYANLGGGAQLQVIQLDTGWISATATSGCRSAPSSAAPIPPSATATAALTGSLSALGSTPTTFHTDAVACATGEIVTVSTASSPMSLANVHAQLVKLPPPGVIVFTSAADRIAWRSGNVSTVIGAADAGTHVDAQQTTTC
jgi:hypothetical protein